MKLLHALRHWTGLWTPRMHVVFVSARGPGILLRCPDCGREKWLGRNA